MSRGDVDLGLLGACLGSLAAALIFTVASDPKYGIERGFYMEIQKGQQAVFVVISGQVYPAAAVGRTIVQGSTIGLFTLGQIVWPGEGRFLVQNLAREGFQVMAAAEVLLDGSQCKIIEANAKREALNCLRGGGAAMLAPRHEGARFMRIAKVGDVYLELMAPRQPNVFVPQPNHRWLLQPAN